MRNLAERALEKNVEKISELGRWHVYEHYDIISDEAGGRYIYAPGKRDGVDNKVVQRLEPLSRTSADLFLKFARWPKEMGMDKDLDTERNAEAAYLWAKTFGVLGLKPANFAIQTLLDSQRVTADYLGMDWRDSSGGRQNLASGGMPEESVANFSFEAWEAHIVWRLYESVRAEGKVDEDTVTHFMSTIDHWEGFNFTVISASGELTPVEAIEYGELSPVEASWIEREIFSGNSELVRRWALTIVEAAVNRKIENHCYPIVQGTTGSYEQNWGFRSLLGAMWLQMLFLMQEDRRCWWCDAPLDPGRRSHARFCDNEGQCRANWNYNKGSGKSSKERRRRSRYIQ
jgi:hypothetical protein